MRTPLAWIAAGFAALIGLILLTLAVAIIWLGTGSGRDVALSQAQKFVPGLGITGAEGNLFDLRLDRLTMADAEGVWLVVEDARLDWSPWALLSRRLDVDLLAAERVEVIRPPLPEPETEPAAGDTGIRLPVAVDIVRLAVARAELGPELAGGEPAVLRLDGRASLPAGTLGGNVHLDVARIDERPGTLVLDARYDPGRRLTLALRAEEPANGLVAEMLDIPGRPPFVLTLEGDGPLTDWTGNLTAKAGDVVDGRAQARIRPADGKLTFGLDAEGDIQALLPADWRELVGPDLKVGAGGLIDPGNSIALDGVTVEIAAGTLAGGGAFDQTTRAVNLGAFIRLPEGSALHGFLGQERFFTDGQGTVTITGTPSVPNLTTDFTVQAPRFQAFQADSLNLKGGVAAQGSTDRLALDLTATLAGLSGGGIENQPATLAVNADVQVPAQTVVIDRLELRGPLLRADGQGRLGNWGAQADLTLDLASPDLAPLSGLAGRELSGALDAKVNLKRQGGELTAGIAGQGRELRLSLPAADALLGAQTEFQGTVTSGTGVSVRDLSVTSPHLSLRGTAALAGERLTADLAAAIPDLSPLGPALGRSLQGGVEATLQAEGPAGATDLALRLQGRDLVLDGLRMGDAQVEVTGQGGPQAAQGRLTAETSIIGQRVAANGGFNLAGDRLRLEGLDAVIGINQVNGALEIDLAAGTASGRLSGTVPDLGIISFVAGDEVWGNGRFDLTLDDAGGRQTVTVDADFKEIWRRWHGQRIATIALDGRVESAAQTMVDMSLRATGIDPGDAMVDELTATAKGPLTATDVTLDIEGEAPAPLKVSLAGTLSTELAAPAQKDGVVLRFDLARFTGQYGEGGFRTAQRASFAYGDGLLRVQGLVINAGDSRMRLDADLSRGALSGRAELVKVPLTWAQIIDPTLTLYGELNGTASLGGSVAAPEGQATLSLTGFSLAPPVEKGPTPLGAELAATWRNGRLALTLALDSQGSGVGLKARGELPLRLDGSATSFAMPGDAPISGRVEGNMALRRLNDLLAGSGDRLGGQVIVDLTLAGTLAQRQLSGTVRLDRASYENQEWGTRISDIQAVLEGDPEGLTIRSFEGRAGRGTVTAAGSIGFRPERGERQIDFTLTAKQATLAQIDMVEAVAGAEIAITGSLRELLVAGRVDIAEAHVRIPDKLPPTVTQLPVVEINHPMRRPPPGGAASAENAPADDAPQALVVRLEVDVEAPNQIYVSGRGLDAELKASLKVRGTVDDPSIAGSVSLVRGEMALLGQTFTINRANLNFDGALEPAMDIEARTQRGDLTAIVAVTGRPSKPSVKLSSQPPYPEDEVLARLLFNRGAGQLSGLEALQLAQSAAQLSGLFGGGPGLVDNVKRSLGVDRLEFRGSEDGSGAGTVAAGRYIGDNLYVGVEQELGTGESQATVEYGITRHIKARGELGTESTVGIQFEWDY